MSNLLDNFVVVGNEGVKSAFLRVYWYRDERWGKHEDIGSVSSGFSLMRYVTHIHDDSHYKIARETDLGKQVLDAISVTDGRNNRRIAEYVLYDGQVGIDLLGQRGEHVEPNATDDHPIELPDGEIQDQNCLTLAGSVKS